MDTIKKVLRNQKLLWTLRHHRIITSAHFWALQQYPEIYVLPFFHHVKHLTMNDPNEYAAEVRKYVDLYHDTVRLTCIDGNADRSIITEASNYNELKWIRGSLCTSLTEEQLETYLHEYHDDFLPNPPVPGSHIVIPIMTIEGLRDESKVMNHCVKTRAKSVVLSQGNTYIYKVVPPLNSPIQRATIEVRIIEGVTRPWELRLTNNDRPNAATFAAVWQWLADYEATCKGSKS